MSDADAIAIAPLTSSDVDQYRPVKMLYLTVTSTNTAAIRLYERNGFVAYGREPRSMRIGDRTFDKLMMSLAVRTE